MLHEANTNDQELISCEVCLKSVPKQDSHCMEADEYVAYFCGLDCYDVWVKKAEQEKKTNQV